MFSVIYPSMIGNSNK